MAETASCELLLMPRKTTPFFSYSLANFPSLGPYSLASTQSVPTKATTTSLAFLYWSREQFFPRKSCKVKGSIFRPRRDFSSA